MLTVAGEFAYVVAGELDDNVVAETLTPMLYGAYGDGFTLDKNLSGSDKKWFVRQIALRLSCLTSDVV